MQKINLYRGDLIKESQNMSLQRMASILILVVALNFLIGGVQLINQMVANADKSDQQELKNKLEKELQMTSEELSPVEIDPTLEVLLVDLKEEEKRKALMLKILLNKKGYQANGYYGLLKDLYDQDISGVWLKEIDFSDAGAKANLQGWVSRPDLLPKYLEALKETESFSGRKFDLFELERDEENPKLLIFRLATEHDPEQLGESAIEQYFKQD